MSGPGSPRAVYDRIGKGYATRRRPDPRIASAIHAAIADGRRIVNVGAGSGSYEPRDRFVAALELSATMIEQRPEGSAPAVRGTAEALPFADDAFDVGLAILTIHHWGDPARGLAELRRVSRRQVIFCIDPDRTRDFWLARDYLPEIAELDEDINPTLAEIEAVLGPLQVSSVSIPHDCRDGFLFAYWRRPEVYLDPAAQRSISTFHRLRDLEAGLASLREDLASGRWRERNRELLAQEAIDCGYRLVVADGGGLPAAGGP